MSDYTYIPPINTSSEYYSNFERNGRFGQYTISGHPQVQGPTGAPQSGSEAAGGIAARMDAIVAPLEGGHGGVQSLYDPKHGWHEAGSLNFVA